MRGTTMRRLVLAVLLAGCSDPPDEQPDAAEGAFDWSLDVTGIDQAFVDVAVVSRDEVYVLGGADDAGVLWEWNGTDWNERLLPDDAGVLWWLWAGGNEVFAVGEHATILTRMAGGWVTIDPGPVTALGNAFYGIWGETADDLWLVGGSFNAGPNSGLIAHWDGIEITIADEAVTREKLLFKVWGTSASDVWAVGIEGRILHYDGATWSVVPSSTTDQLISVMGRSPDEVYAVGGSGRGLVLGWDGVAWSTFAEGPEELAGVYTEPGAALYVSGRRGYLARYGAFDTSDPDPQARASAVPTSDVDFHALAGRAGLVVAVGGDLQSGGQPSWLGTVASHAHRFEGPLHPVDRDAPPPPDAEPDAPIDAAPDGPMPGAECFELEDPVCTTDFQCWYLMLSGVKIWTQNCADPSECAAYGSGACCTPPGPQTLCTVCIPQGFAECP